MVVENLKEGFGLVAEGSLCKLFFDVPPAVFTSVLLVTLAAAAFVVSTITDNYSQIDRLWSMLPVGLVAYWWYRLPVTDHRATIMFLLAATWGIRLSFNFWRKGGYGIYGEDYRWKVLQEKITPLPLWMLFNLLFISVYQIILLFLFSSPIVIVYGAAGKVPFGTYDVLLLFGHLFFLVTETIADQQQWNFQEEKKRRIKANSGLVGDYKRGFITSGLFQFSRHPNFFSEISLWWFFWGFSVTATNGNYLNWSLAGPVLLTLLFQGSTNFTEELTLKKYPDYAQYQATTSRLLPWLPGPALKSLKSNGKDESAPATSPRARPVKKVAAVLETDGTPSTKQKSEPSASSPKGAAKKQRRTTDSSEDDSSSRVAAKRVASPAKKVAKHYDEDEIAPRPKPAAAPKSPKASGAKLVAAPKSPMAGATLVTLPRTLIKHPVQEEVEEEKPRSVKKTRAAPLSPKGRK